MAGDYHYESYCWCGLDHASINYQQAFEDGRRWVRTTQAIDAYHIVRQKEWSTKTFGPGPRTAGVMDHIQKEFKEILADPSDKKEWIDVIILALDGAWRSGLEPQEIIDAIIEKQTINESRQWKDWRTMSEDEAIEHTRE